MKPSLLVGEKTHRELHDLLKTQTHLTVSGVSNETAKSLVTSHILSFDMFPTLLVTNQSSIEAFQHWFSFFEQEVLPLAPVESGAEAFQHFLFLMQGKKKIFLCSESLWEEEFPSFADLEEKKIRLQPKQKIVFTQFVEDLLDRGYQHGKDLYLHPGEYRRIGDTLDIHPIQSPNPYRVTFNLDVVERISLVDRDDLSRLIQEEPTLDIFPALFTQKKKLVEQLRKDSLLILDDQDDIDPPLHTTTLRFSAFPEGAKVHTHLRYLSVIKFYTLTDFLNDLRDKIQQEWRIVIVTRRASELEKIFTEEHIPCTTERRSIKGVTLLSEDSELLPHSIQNPDLKCALITDREIFSLKKSTQQKSIQKLALEFITSLGPGDYVVHMEHGIGKFEGVTQKLIDDTTREYLELTYAEGDKLFIPVDQADKLSKFVYEEGNEPRLTRLGTSDWKRLTEKMRQETQKIAKELLELYAKRASVKGFAYPDDTPVQKKFEEAFSYQETPGQLKAIEDFKRDMESDHPMDRLVCGDVGFGKTEVAMRAAFKAVQAGKQVAVIAPITILADQHYGNFRDRMKDFGVRIEMLSRFRTAREQTGILEKLRKGDIDIVIGTHRLLQEDVQFQRLGLVVIDEEQRFGVKQKERFKEMRSSVDILTLTATPIPRTLNLGLHKLRDITTITTPPPGRLPIITEVRKYSDTLVRDAVLKEFERGGQCFILHNRVETIDAFAEKLRKLIPEATFIVGHGQLKSEELEQRILAFKQGKYDVLVSSTIIENGIDLPRANTLVVNEAERFGLAQLYQLRGRVGRSKIQAHAYFLYHSQKLKDDAKKRLRAIVEACELGSGFQVAMRDLEIRGAGEILGAEQSGTMQTVGISHYLRMLKVAIEEIKAGKRGVAEEVENVEILLPIEALLPSFYIPDQEERISVYQKLAGSETPAILEEFQRDLIEEYGPPPKPVENLFGVLHLKMACRKAGVHRVKAEDRSKDVREIVLFLSPRVTAKEIMQLLKINHQWRISGSTLRINQTEFEQGEKKLLSELRRHVEALVRKKKTEQKE